MKRWLVHPAAKPVVFVLCLLPLGLLILAALGDQLGVNPQETLIRRTGDWTLRLLCITLAITPLRQWTGLGGLLRFRRMLGLFAFFYGSLHFLAYGGLDQGFEPAVIARDIAKRPFILVGFSAWLLMLPLAATSFNRAIRALTPRRWQQLHRAVYAVVLLGLLHFFWMRAAKHNFGEWLVYAVIVALLLGWRLARTLLETLRARRRSAA
jgi:sulfoxide reductase heme-binding subunit YedZ